VPGVQTCALPISKDVGAVLRPLRGVLTHQFASPVRVRPGSLHDLNETGPVRVTDRVDDDVGRVTKRRLAREVLGELGPPPVLLWPVAVAAGVLLGLKARQGDEPPVIRHASGGADPTGRPGCQFLLPTVEGLVHLVPVDGLAFYDLYEHRISPIPERP